MAWLQPVGDSVAVRQAVVLGRAGQNLIPNGETATADGGATLATAMTATKAE